LTANGPSSVRFIVIVIVVFVFFVVADVVVELFGFRFGFFGFVGLLFELIGFRFGFVGFLGSYFRFFGFRFGWWRQPITRPHERLDCERQLLFIHDQGNTAVFCVLEFNHWSSSPFFRASTATRPINCWAASLPCTARVNQDELVEIGS
jgi:hypothetical protein